MKNLFAITLIIILIFLIFALSIVLLQFFRGLLKNYEDKNALKYVMFILVGAEYFLLALTIYNLETNPFQINTPMMTFDPGTGASVGINDSIYYSLVAAFGLICITSFEHSLPTFKTNRKHFILRTVIVFVIIVTLAYTSNYLIDSYRYKHRTAPYGLVETLEYVSTIIFVVSVTAVYFFAVTPFRINRQKMVETTLFTFLPVVIFYCIVLYCQAKDTFFQDEQSMFYHMYP
jgi:hypothetical protein